MTRFRLRDRLRYGFDNLMARGSIVLILGLGLVSLLLILVAAIVIITLGVAPAGEPPLPFPEAAWQSLMRSLDAGTMGQDRGWEFRFVMFGVTLGGIFIISTLIGLLTNALQLKLSQLRKGRSQVIETDHTVILGWTPAIFTIIFELVTANRHRKRSCIVVLGDREKAEMEDEIREKIGPTGNTHVVCRQGNPIDQTDLEIVSLQNSRAIIILKPETENSDAAVIKIILAIMNNPKRRLTPYHIVTCIRDPKNLALARMIGQEEVALLQINELLSRVTAQTCRRSGLSVIYSMLLNFEDDEIYFRQDPRLVGKTFGEILPAFENASVIGLMPRNGPAQLNPPMDRKVGPDDQIIAIAQNDEDTNLFKVAKGDIDPDAIRCGKPFRLPVEKTLILGWNWRVPNTIRELDHYVASGSEVTVVCQHPEAAEKVGQECTGLVHQTVSCRQGDTTDRRVLEGLGIQAFDRIIVQSYSDTLPVQEADSVTMMTLLHLRDMAERDGNSVSIVSEMLDVRNRTLADVARADDFILSNHFVSLMLAQISQNKHLMEVFEDLFDSAGSEIYLKKAGEFVELGRPVSFFTIVEAGRRKGEIAIGYRLHAFAHNPAENYGVVVNPLKSEKVSFAENDRIIVISESEECPSLKGRAS